MIIGGIVVALVLLGVIIFVVISMTSKKLACTSSKGDITIMYNDDKITGYTANGMTYDMDQQQAVAELVGIDTYIDTFEEWFEENAGGTCERK